MFKILIIDGFHKGTQVTKHDLDPFRMLAKLKSTGHNEIIQYYPIEFLVRNKDGSGSLFFFASTKLELDSSEVLGILIDLILEK